MDPLLLLGLIAFGMLAGILGTIFGLGGGVIIVPVLTVVYDMGPAEAVAVSLVGIIAASVGAASFYVKNKVSNIRLGLLLEISTVIGAICGALLAVYVDGMWLTLLFAVIIVYSGVRMIMKQERDVEMSPSETSEFSYYDTKEKEEHGYGLKNVRSGSLVCIFAGAMSSMTGVGGGAIKVPLMNMHMNVPIKAATATSSYMIGITAFSGAIIYFIGGQVLLEYAGAIAVGSFFGSIVGTYISGFIPAKDLKKYFSVVLFVLAAIVLMNAGGII